MNDKDRGSFIIIGGAEDKKYDKEVLKRVCDFVDKEIGVILITTIATEYSNESFEMYNTVFSELGVKNIRKLHIKCRRDSFLRENIEIINKADLVFFTGGDQLRITSLVGGTPILRALKDISASGRVLVGTSAGASIMSNTMIVEGEDEESPRKCTLKMSPGLGFLENVIIDQHFAQRGRIGRILTAIAQNPEVLGIGIDEDTAVIISSENIAEVVGSGAVYIIDGRSITHSNVSEQYANEVLNMFDIRLHVLKSGDKFDFLTNRPLMEGRNSYENNKD